MEHLPVIILRGAVIGLLVSAPMGPIGVLVIQRTLNKGRRPALYTGFGAALSDLIYCLLTGLGLSLVTDFIETHQALLQVIGSAMLLAYGTYLFLHNPARNALRPPQLPSGGTYWKEFVTGFIFTFANPLILFFIIGLFARFSFLAPEFRAYHYIAGYAAIASGAIGWWFTVTYFVDKLRSRFNDRTMWVINRVIASLLLVMAAVGMATGIMDL